MPEPTDATLETLYQQLKRYGQVVQQDRRLSLAGTDSVTVRSPLCGSALTLDAVIADQRVIALGWAVRACALGQASTAIVIERQNQLNQAQVGAMAAQLRDILAGTRERSDWPELELFALVRDIPNRHASVLLPFEALERLFERACRPSPPQPAPSTSGCLA